MHHLEEKVCQIIQRHTGIRIETADADLWKDLGIEGDDVDEMFMALDRELGPLSFQDIRADRHFEMNEPPWFLGRWGRRWRLFKAQRIPARVRDIVEWVKTGNWPICYDGHERTF